jgi:hypothetical protein
VFVLVGGGVVKGDGIYVCVCWVPSNVEGVNAYGFQLFVDIFFPQVQLAKLRITNEEKDTIYSFEVVWINKSEPYMISNLK